MRLWVVMIQLIAVLLIGQVSLPPEFDRTSQYLSNLNRGQTVRVYSNAMIVDPNGKCWIRGDWVAETATDKYMRHKELEITRSKNGYIVRVLPLWSERDHYYRYPEWQRSVHYPTANDIPVIAFVVVPKPKPRRSYFSELDAYYRSDAPRYSPPPLPPYMRD